MFHEIEIEYLGQSGFRLAVGDSILLIDPSNKKSGEFDGGLLYCTHKHTDHTGGVSTFLNRNKNALFIANEQVLQKFPEYEDRSIKAVPGKSHTHGIWTLEFIEGKWNEFNAKRPFSYQFLDEQMDEMYQSEEKVSAIIQIAAVLTIFIALLGLLGLSSFVAEQRTKEIAIRKVLGASVSNILQLLYREFALLIAIAFIIAVPISWWRLEIWLNASFVYHQPLEWSYFLIAGLTSFVIGLGTISFYILRAATGNPVNAIKYE